MDQNNILDALYKKLPDYIQYLKLTINRKGYFPCPTKKHSDEHPSCHVIPYMPHLWHCFGCNFTGNIFHLAHYVEQLPLHGQEFWTVTVPALAEKFGIIYEPRAISDEEKSLFKRYRAYKDAASIICQYPDDPKANIYQFLKERSWKLETAKLMGIGAIRSFDDYVQQMEGLGWTRDYLHTVELLNQNLFNEHNLIFVFYDVEGRPVGFVARNTRWSKGSKEPKYINSTTSVIYRKGSLLYNIHNAKQYTPPLWIVEGYPDCVRMFENGIRNVVALGSTALTDNEQSSHISLLRSLGIRDIILLFDQDDGGNQGLERALNIFAHHRGFNVKICTLPENTDDPDTYILKYGIEAFRNLPFISPFDYKLSKYKWNDDKEKICKEMIEVIASEPSPITQSRMIKALAQRTDFSESAIENELKYMTGDIDFNKHMEFKNLQNIIIQESRKAKNTLDLQARIASGLAQINNIIDVYNLDANQHESYEMRIADVYEKCASDLDPGFHTGEFKIFESVTDGIPKHGSFIGLAAVPNAGKTSFLRHLSWEMVKSNPDILLIYMSIDDSFQKIVTGYISLISGLTIAEVSKAKSKIWDDPNKKAIWQLGWDTFKQFQKRLIVKDAKDGTTSASLEKHIKFYQKLMPDKKICVILDNFHKLQDFPDSGEKYFLLSNRIKEITTLYDVPIISTMELRKTAEFEVKKPTMQDVKESVGIVYDADMVLILHQDLHVNRNTKKVWFFETPQGPKKMPLVEIDFVKNKEGDFKGTLYYKFITNMSRFQEIDEVQFEQITKRDECETMEFESTIQDEQFEKGQPFIPFELSNGTNESW